MVELANTIWADGPSGSPQQPDKAQIRSWGTWVETGISSALNGSHWYQTKTEATAAAVSLSAGTFVVVYGDATTLNNGSYRVVSGVLVKATDFIPGWQVVFCKDNGTSTANAYAMQSQLYVPSTDGAVLIFGQVPVTNTSGTVTITFDGGVTTYAVKTAAGNNPPVGGLVAGLPFIGQISASGSVFRLLSDITSSAIQAAAETAATSAQGYRDQAANYATLSRHDVVVKEFAGDGTTVSFDLGIDPGSISNLLAVVDGVAQLQAAIASLSGTVVTFASAPPGDGLTKNINIRVGYAIGVNTPATNTVGSAQIKTSEAAAIRSAIGAVSATDISAAIGNSVSGLAIANNATDAVNDIDIAAGTITSADGTLQIALASALTKRLDATFAAGTGNGGRFDTSISDGTWNVFLIGNGSAVDVGFSKSLNPTSAANYPSGYKYARIGHFTRATSIRPFTQYGTGRERVYKLRTPVGFASAVTSMGTSAVLRSLQSGGIDIVPTGLKVIAEMTVMVATTGTAGENFRIFSPDDTDSAVDSTNETHDIAVGVAGRSRHSEFIVTNTSGQVYTRCSVGGSGTFLTASVLGWKDYL